MTSDCVLWQGAKNNKGYGKRRVAGKDWLAHRYAWTIEKGPIPAGFMLLHSCDNRSCINVEHLSLGTGQDNMADAKAKGRRLGRPGNSPREAKITDIMSGLSDAEIAKKHNTSRGAIYKLRKTLESR